MSLAEPQPKDRRFKVNPVLARELKERMRSPRATVILVVYLALLAGILYLTYRLGLLTLRSQFMGGGMTSSSMAAASLGRLMFEVLLIFLLGLVAFIAPGASTGAIAGERERGTLQLLQVTLLKPSAILTGKLAASLGFVMLLLLASLPLFTVALILGGVTPQQAFRGLVVVTTLAIFLSTLGTYLSSVARRTLHATIGTYALTFVLLFGTVLTYGAERVARSSGFLSSNDRPVSTYLNPFAALADAVVDPRSGGFLPSPLSVAREMIPGFMPGLGGGFSEPPVSIATGEAEGRSWQLTARIEPSSGLCVGLQESNGGGESCGNVDPNLMVFNSFSPNAGPILYGTVTPDAVKVRVDMVEGDPVEVDPLTEEAEEAGFETSFFVAVMKEGQEPATVTALDEDDKEISSEPVGAMMGNVKGGFGIPMPMAPPIPVPDIAQGATAPAPDLPATLVPVPGATPVPAAAPAPAPEAAAVPPAGTSSIRNLGGAAVDEKEAAARLDREAATKAEAAGIAPPTDSLVMVDPPVDLPMPAPMPIRAIDPGFGINPVANNDPLPVWAVHSAILLTASLVLIFLGSRQLRRPAVKFRARKAA